MYFGRFFLFFTIYCGIIVFCEMVKGAEKDIYNPNSALKTYTSMKVRKVIYSIIIFLFVYAIGFHIVLDIPRLVNRDFVMFTGEIQNIEKAEGNKYNIVIENGGKLRCFNNVYAENPRKGSYVEIGCPPNPLYMDIVVKSNNKVTNIYQKYYGHSFFEKLLIIIYGFLNFIVQFRQIQKAKKLTYERDNINLLWEISLCLFTIVLLVSLLNIINNFFVGVFAAILFAVYNLCYLKSSYHYHIEGDKEN